MFQCCQVPHHNAEFQHDSGLDVDSEGDLKAYQVKALELRGGLAGVKGSLSPLAAIRSQDASAKEPRKKLTATLPRLRRPAPVETGFRASGRIGGAFDALLELKEAGGADLGLTLAYSTESAVYVVSTASGQETAVGRYNMAAPEHCRILPGDYLVSANRAPPVQRHFAAAGPVELRVRRPSLFHVEFSKAGRPLGLQLRYAEEGTGVGLLVTAVRAWGALAADGAGVRVGDRILSVDGQRGTARELLARLRDGEQASLEISRCV